MNLLDQIEEELLYHDVIQAAAEPWNGQYKRDKGSYKKLIKLQGTMARTLRRYFREFGERAETYIDWQAYDQLLIRIQGADDFKVDVVILEGSLGAEDTILISTLYEPIVTGVSIGADAGEAIYSRPVGLTKSSQSVQRAAKDMVADLVGKRVTDDGLIVDNPKAKYRITDKARADIRESIATSLSQGEKRQEAAERVRKIVSDPRRADIIARTESVNAYQRGMSVFARESGAKAKEWQTSSVTPGEACYENAKQGAIPLNQAFQSGHMEPTAHPNCYCATLYLYDSDIE